MRFTRIDDYASRAGEFTICRVFVGGKERFVAWKGKEMLGWVEAGENRREAWKQAIAICEKESSRI